MKHVVAKHIFVAFVLIGVLCGTASAQEERTLEEFKEYVASKLSQLSEDQLSDLAKRVDQNNDGVISADEFDQRMRFVQAVLSGPSEPAKPVETKDYLDGEPVIIPPLVADAPADLLLVTAGSLAEAWLEFARWKTSQGIVTKIVTIRQIARAYEANNIQEKIRLCVREHIEQHGTQWVLLGGDSEPGGGLVPGGHHTYHEDEPRGIPTDIVYLSPTNWDADGDQRYGEWEDDREAITYPDGSVGLGRVPVRTVDDVAAYTEKVVAYESQFPEDTFATEMLYTSTDEASTAKVMASWDRHIGPAWGGEVSRFFADQTPWDEEGKPGSFALSDTHLMGLINKKAASKLHIHGHGLLDRWILEGSELDASEVRTLSNQGAYPLITTVSCNTGEFDSRQDPAVVEQMLRVPNAGSVAIVAPVRTGKMHFHNPDTDFDLMINEGKLDGTTMTMTLYWTNGLEQDLTTGEALMLAKKTLKPDAKKSASYHLAICELNLLGDPTLRFRAKAPRTPSVKLPENLPEGSTELRVETDAPGADVCAWNESGYYQSMRANTQGVAKFKIPATSKGPWIVTVSGSALNTIQADLSNDSAADSSTVAVLPADANEDGKVTIDEFQGYVSEKLPDLTAKKLERIAALVDANSDGTIDSAEFDSRMQAVQKAMSEPEEKKKEIF